MKKVCGLAIVLATVLLLRVTPIMGQSESFGYVIVANKEVAGNTIKMQVLKGIYLREIRSWGNGGTIVPVDYSSANEFYENLFGKSRVQMQVYWMNMRIKYSVEIPVAKKDSESVKQFIADNKGAIGFLKSSDVDDRVKVLKVTE